MTERERILSFFHHMDAPMCATCAHFEQHYHKNPESGEFTPLHEGHCVYPRIKIRKPYDLCTNYERKE